MARKCNGNGQLKWIEGRFLYLIACGIFRLWSSLPITTFEMAPLGAEMSPLKQADHEIRYWLLKFRIRSRLFLSAYLPPFVSHSFSSPSTFTMSNTDSSSRSISRGRQLFVSFPLSSTWTLVNSFFFTVVHRTRWCWKHASAFSIRCKIRI